MLYLEMHFDLRDSKQVLQVMASYPHNRRVVAIASPSFSRFIRPLAQRIIRISVWVAFS